MTRDPTREEVYWEHTALFDLIEPRGIDAKAGEVREENRVHLELRIVRSLSELHGVLVEHVDRTLAVALGPEHAIQAGHLAVEHVKQICHNQGNARSKEAAHPEKYAAPYIQGHSNNGEDVWIDMAMC